MAEVDAAVVEAGGTGGVEGREDGLTIRAPGEVEKPMAVGAESHEVGVDVEAVGERLQGEFDAEKHLVHQRSAAIFPFADIFSHPDLALDDGKRKRERISRGGVTARQSNLRIARSSARICQKL